MKKYGMILLMLSVLVSCDGGIPKEGENEANAEKPNATGRSLSLSGTIINMDNESAFKVQLIEGSVSTANFNETYTHPDAQVFVTEKNRNDFEFNNLQEGKYMLIATKRGYKISNVSVDIRKDKPNVVSIKMEKGGNSGFTNKLQILNEDGGDLSEIQLFPNSTLSVFFYLYNGKGTDESYTITYRHNEGLIAKYFIINGQSTLLNSNWIKDIKPRIGTLKPNEIKLIEVVIDPFVYILREHSKCDIEIDENLKIELFY